MKLEYDHLIGLQFGGIGTRDCFSLVKDFFKKNFNIDIPDFARPHDWRANENDLIRKCFPHSGFDSITNWKPTDLRPGDILAIMIGEANPNHLAIVVDDAKILHHLMGRMSTLEPLRDFWLNQTSFVLRHPDVPDLRPSYPDVEIGSLLRARNAPPGE